MTSPTSAPASSWARAALRPARSSKPPTSPAPRGPKQVGPFAVPKAMSSTASATLSTWFKIKGVELFDLLGLRDLEPLHRRGLRAHPDGQAGRDVRRRLRGAGLDAVGAVRRDGRDVVGLQRDAGARLARLRQEPRRVRDFGRRRRAGSRGLRAGQGARREDLRRDRRVRRDLGRPRHGRARRAKARRAACARRWRR